MKFCVVPILLCLLATTSNGLEELPQKLVNNIESSCEGDTMNWAWNWAWGKPTFPGHIYMKGYQNDTDPNSECAANEKIRMNKSKWNSDFANFDVPFGKCGTTVGRSVSSQQGFFVSGTLVFHMNPDRNIISKNDIHHSIECLFLDENKWFGFDKREEMQEAVKAKFGDMPTIRHSVYQSGNNPRRPKIGCSVDHQWSCRHPKGHKWSPPPRAMLIDSDGCAANSKTMSPIEYTSDLTARSHSFIMFQFQDYFGELYKRSEMLFQCQAELIKKAANETCADVRPRCPLSGDLPYTFPPDPDVNSLFYDTTIFSREATPDAVADFLINAMDKYVVHTSSDENSIFYAHVWGKLPPDCPYWLCPPDYREK